MEGKNSFPILENLARLMGCEYLSELKYLDTKSRLVMAGLVEKLEPGQATVQEWNDALAYLTGRDPEPDAERARLSLIAGLENRS